MKPPRPVLVQRVKLNPFRNYHSFNYQIQCLRSKIKFVWGCGARRQYERISISKNKAPPLLLQMVNCSPFRHCHWFYYHSQCLRRRIKFVWGSGSSRQSESISFFKKRAFPLVFQRVNWSPFEHYHCFYYHSQCLKTKTKFVWGCGASRQFESITISKKKAFLLLFQRLNWSHLDIIIVFTSTVNV